MIELTQAAQAARATWETSSTVIAPILQFCSIGHVPSRYARIEVRPVLLRTDLEMTTLGECAIMAMCLVQTTETPGSSLWGLVRQVPGIEMLRIDPEDDGLDVWIIGNELSWEHQKQLFHLYRRWIKEHPSICAELHVVDRENTPIEVLLSRTPDTIEYKKGSYGCQKTA